MIPQIRGKVFRMTQPESMAGKWFFTMFFITSDADELSALQYPSIGDPGTPGTIGPIGPFETQEMALKEFEKSATILSRVFERGKWE